MMRRMDVQDTRRKLLGRLSSDSLPDPFLIAPSRCDHRNNWSGCRRAGRGNYPIPARVPSCPGVGQSCPLAGSLPSANRPGLIVGGFHLLELLGVAPAVGVMFL